MAEALEGNTELLIPLPVRMDVETFTDEGQFDDILGKIRKVVDDFEPDISTAKGRKAIASMAFKVTKTKTELDRQGKALTEEWRKQTGLVNASRRRMTEALDALKDEVRAPLDTYEAEEQARKEKVQENLKTLEGYLDASPNEESSLLKTMLAGLEPVDLDPKCWGEFTGQATVLKERALKHLKTTIEAAEKREADEAELEALRKEKAEREAKEAAERAAHEEAERRAEQERLQAEAQERARLEAEARVRAEEQRKADEAKAEADRKVREAEERAARAEAEAQAKLEAERRAQEEERQRIIRQKEAEEAAALKRQADLEHRATIDAGIVKAMHEGAAIPESKAKAFIALINSGGVPNVSIQY